MRAQAAVSWGEKFWVSRGRIFEPQVISSDLAMYTHARGDARDATSLYSNYVVAGDIGRDNTGIGNSAKLQS